MKVSYKWLQEYVDLQGLSAEAIAEKMTLAGVTVEHIEYLGEGLDGVVVGLVAQRDKHPDADKLSVCLVDIGQPEKLQIVCGAKNVAAGQKVPVATIGTKLPDGLKIKKGKLRGVESQGMICSATELGIDESSVNEESRGGILILSEDTLVGSAITEVLGLDDIVMELELTPNRADCLSMLGVAREVAALLETEVKEPVVTFEEIDSIEGKVAVEIQEPELCKAYLAKMVKDVKIGPSPSWMQERLKAAGLRPISNVVDVTNFVMLEMGQPLHAFDYETIKEGKIIVRKAKAGEVMVSLDGATRTLDEEMLVIADSQDPMAIAGVMGGEVTEVTDQTTTVVLESAFFNGASIRRTSRRLGLRSESSSRFEKGIDLGGTAKAINRAAQLLAETAGGQVVGGIVEVRVAQPEPRIVELSLTKVDAYLGMKVPQEVSIKILENLSFRVVQDGDKVSVTVPTYRPDISLDVDLIEEIARVYGYDKIPTTLPSGQTLQGKLTQDQLNVDRVREAMLALGFDEIITLSFENPKNFNNLRLQNDSELRNSIKLQNPLSEDQSLLRTALIASQLEVIARNQNRRNLSGAFFELGKTYHPQADSQLAFEPLRLCASVVGQTSRHWLEPVKTYDFFYLKGALETLLADMGVTQVTFRALSSNPTFHPGRTAEVLLGEEVIGVIGELHPEVIENFDLQGRVIACEINMGPILANAQTVRKYQALPKFPGMSRDLAFVLKEEIPVEHVTDIIYKKGGNLLKEVQIFDVYQGKQIEQGYKSLALSLRYQAQDRTLTDEEVNKLQDKIREALAKELEANLR